ncbi:MAG: enoyl-CoA hydratase/isomerase family protein, partial [Desulfobacula sp.]|nr:enoyl-CoA hydratase/isomerase family protein [Desulfobacula sp.]
MLEKEIQDNIVIACLTGGATNSITIDTLRQLKAIVDEVNENDDLKGIILTGQGRFFSSGFSLPIFIDFEKSEDVISFFEEEEKILLDYFTCKKPVVCALNGHAAAMGLILAMASDYRIVKKHPKIKLGMSEIKIGLSLTIAQSSIVRFGLDSDRCYRNIMYFGEMVGVDTALEMKMVDEVVDEKDLIDRAKEIVCLWIDTPNRPFVQIKQNLKTETAKKISHALKTENWQDPLAQTLLNQEVKAIL